MSELSKRVIACRAAGKIGGARTAQNSTKEFLETRASNAGKACVAKYGTEFYAHISQNVQKKRNVVKEVQEEVTGKSVSEPMTSTDLMKAATKLLV